jgi:hypothetical protein
MSALKYPTIFLDIHCKDTIPKIWNKIFPERELCGHSPNFTFVCLWAIYIFPQSICLFCCRKYVDRSWKYINSSQIHECGNWDWGRAIPRKEIHKWDIPCSVGSVLYPLTLSLAAIAIAASPLPPSGFPIFIFHLCCLWYITKDKHFDNRETT